MRTTAQGTVHSENCKWKAYECEGCIQDLLEEGKEGYYTEFGYETHEGFVEDILDIYSDNVGDLEETCTHVRCECVPPNHLLDDYVVYFENRSVQDDLKALVSTLEEGAVDYHPELLTPSETKKGQVRDLVHPSLYCFVDETLPPSERYQWLPAEVKVERNEVEFQTYVNGYHGDVTVFEKALVSFLPSLRKVIGNFNHLQVITKVASITLREGESYEGGSWHIEGMPYERIVATCLQYVDVAVENSFLEFRKPVWINEENVEYEQNDVNYTRKHFGITDHHQGEMNRYLGLIKCEEGNGVVFANTLQHRVKPFPGPGKRTILAFFVVDPNNRILSTLEVPRQEGKISREQAERNRIDLMIQRKYFVDELNQNVYEREYSLCEH